MDGDTTLYGSRPIDEMIKPKPQATEMKTREEYENHVLASSSNIVHTTVIRPGFVYGGRGGFVADLFYSQKLVMIISTIDLLIRLHQRQTMYIF
jgi:hypothetical protein